MYMDGMKYIQPENPRKGGLLAASPLRAEEKGRDVLHFFNKQIRLFYKELSYFCKNTIIRHEINLIIKIS